MRAPSALPAFWVVKLLVGLFPAQKTQFGKVCVVTMTLQWHHNEHDGILNHQPYDCLLNHLFSLSSRKTPKFCITGLYTYNGHTGDWWIPCTEGQLHGKCFLLMMSSWINSCKTGKRQLKKLNSFWYQKIMMNTSTRHWSMFCHWQYVPWCEVQCSAIITRSIFSQIFPDPYSLPARMRYGVSFVSDNSDICSVSVTVVLRAVSCYIGPCYTRTWLCWLD